MVCALSYASCSFTYVRVDMTQPSGRHQHIDTVVRTSSSIVDRREQMFFFFFLTIIPDGSLSVSLSLSPKRHKLRSEVYCIAVDGPLERGSPAKTYQHS